MIRTATKQTSAYLLLLIAAMPLVYILFASVQQQYIRHRMKEQLEAQVLQTITIPENVIHWIKNGKEIFINGRMFDIKSSRPAGNGRISFTGLYDDDETALLNTIRKNQQNENNSDGKFLAQLFQLLHSSFKNTFPEVIIPSLNNNPFPGIEQRLTSQFLTILSPPPQV